MQSIISCRRFVETILGLMFKIWFCRKLDSAIGSLASFSYDILISVEECNGKSKKVSIWAVCPGNLAFYPYFSAGARYRGLQTFRGNVSS